MPAFGKGENIVPGPHADNNRSLNSLESMRTKNLIVCARYPRDCSEAGSFYIVAAFLLQSAFFCYPYVSARQGQSSTCGNCSSTAIEAFPFVILSHLRMYANVDRLKVGTVT